MDFAVKRLLLLAAALVGFAFPTAAQIGGGLVAGPPSLSSLGAAKSGANSDITSLTGLTTPLPPNEGGTGVANNAASTLAISGNFASTFIVSGAFSYTFPGASASLAPLVSPSFTTPALGVATGTSLALGGATIGTNALAVTGTAIFSSTIVASGAVSGTAFTSTVGNINSAARFQFGNSGTFQATGDGIWLMRNNADTDFTRLMFGGNTASFPAIGRSGTSLVIQAADGTLQSFVTPSAAANIQLGAAAVDTAPVAQTLSVQNTLAGGTSNVAGANFTIAGSQGKGTGAGGSLIFQTAAAGSTGTTVNPLVTALTIDSTGLATFAAGVTAAGNVQGNNIVVGGGFFINGSSRFGSGGTSIWQLVRANNTADISLDYATVGTLKVRNGANNADAAITASTVTLSALANAATTSAVCYNTGTGVLSYDGTIGTCTVSALRYKNVLSSVDDKSALKGLDALRVGVWEYKDEYRSRFDSRVHVGLYADDVAKMDPRCVGYKDGKVENYDDRCILGYLVAAVQELKKERR